VSRPITIFLGSLAAVAAIDWAMPLHLPWWGLGLAALLVAVPVGIAWRSVQR
jgi:hypothetical protein